MVDPLGKPVAGAEVFLCYWLHGAPLDYTVQPRAVTNDEGRFEFTTTRSDFEPGALEAWRASNIVATAAGFGFTAGSSIAFETTGKALKLISPEALVYFKELFSNPNHVLRLVRDDTPITGRVETADGRYRLEGLPIGKAQRVLVFPKAQTALLPGGLSVSTKTDEPTLTRNFQLKQGILVRGQAVDDRTGKPLPGRVQYVAFRDNPYLKSFPLFSKARLYHERRTDEDGRFEIAVLPGSGIITFMASDHTRCYGLSSARSNFSSIRPSPSMVSNESGGGALSLGLRQIVSVSSSSE